MRNRKSLTSSEPSVSVVIGIVRWLFLTCLPAASVDLHITMYSTRKAEGAGQILLGLAVRTAERRIEWQLLYNSSWVKRALNSQRVA